MHVILENRVHVQVNLHPKRLRGVNGYPVCVHSNVIRARIMTAWIEPGIELDAQAWRDARVAHPATDPTDG